MISQTLSDEQDQLLPYLSTTVTTGLGTAT